MLLPCALANATSHGFHCCPPASQNFSLVRPPACVRTCPLPPRPAGAAAGPAPGTQPRAVGGGHRPGSLTLQNRAQVAGPRWASGRHVSGLPSLVPAGGGCLQARRWRGRAAPPPRWRPCQFPPHRPSPPQRPSPAAGNLPASPNCDYAVGAGFIFILLEYFARCTEPVAFFATGWQWFTFFLFWIVSIVLKGQWRSTPALLACLSATCCPAAAVVLPPAPPALQACGWCGPTPSPAAGCERRHTWR